MTHKKIFISFLNISTEWKCAYEVISIFLTISWLPKATKPRWPETEHKFILFYLVGLNLALYYVALGMILVKSAPAYSFANKLPQSWQLQQHSFIISWVRSLGHSAVLSARGLPGQSHKSSWPGLLSELEIWLPISPRLLFLWLSTGVPISSMAVDQKWLTAPRGHSL